MSRIPGIAICLALVLPLTVPAQENYRLDAVEISGNRTFGDDVLRQQMVLDPQGTFSRVVLRRDPFLFSGEILQNDLRRLTRFYQREGFLNVAVSEAERRVDHAEQTIRLTIAIEEGEAVRVGPVALLPDSGATALPAARVDSLRSALALRDGVRFRDEALSADRDRLAQRLVNAGYPFARVTYRLTLDEAAGRADIRWLLSPGERCVFGEVRITGTVEADPALIRPLVAFSPGDRYDPRLLDRSQRRIYRLGLFQIVVVKSLLGKRDGNAIPVEIQVREAPRLSSKLGVGYGREEKFRIFTETRRLGFLSGARRAVLYAKHSALEPYNLDLKVTRPFFLTLATSLTYNPFLRRQKEPGFDVRRYGLNLTAQHSFTDIIDGFVSYGFERVRLDTASVARVTPASGVATALSTDLYNKSSVTAGLTRDSSQPLFSPTRGMLSSISATYSGLGFNSTYHFWRTVAELRRYEGLGWDVVLAWKVKGGLIASSDPDEIVPTEERFYAGGSQSVRGWSRAALGPSDADGTPIGGKSLLEGSVELRVPVWRWISLALFADGGNVWLDSRGHQPADLRYAAGSGLRIETPIGPVRLDVARPVGEDLRDYQIFLSVGQAF